MSSYILHRRQHTALTASTPDLARAPSMELAKTDLWQLRLPSTQGFGVQASRDAKRPRSAPTSNAPVDQLVLSPNVPEVTVHCWICAARAAIDDSARESGDNFARRRARGSTRPAAQGCVMEVRTSRLVGSAARPARQTRRDNRRDRPIPGSTPATRPASTRVRRRAPYARSAARRHLQCAHQLR